MIQVLAPHSAWKEESAYEVRTKKTNEKIQPPNTHPLVSLILLESFFANGVIYDARSLLL